MAVKFGSILHVNNSGSEATLDANNLRGTTLQIDSFNSASLAKIGAGLSTAPGKRRLGSIVTTTSSAEYYLYSNSGSGDILISGSDWTNLNHWKQIATTDRISGSFTTISSSFATRMAGIEVNASQELNADSSVTFFNISSSRITASELLVNESTRLDGAISFNGMQIFEDQITVRSGSTQFGSGSVGTAVQTTTHEFTGSVSITGSLTIDENILLPLGSIQATNFIGTFDGAFSSSNQLPLGIVSGSSQLPLGIVSGSSQLPLGIVSGSSQLPLGLISGSTQLPLGIISGSSQLPLGLISGSTQLPLGIISGSSQLPSGLISGSTQLPLGIISGSTQLPLGLISGSSQLPLGIISGSSQLPSGLISGSIFQVSITASANISASGDVIANQIIIGGGTFTSESLASGGTSSPADFSSVTEDILPNGTHNLGAFDKKWQAIFAEDTFFGGIHEINLETTGLDQLQAGTVLVYKAGKMVPCTTEADPLIMGIVSSGSNFPIILGAEPVLVHGAVYEGDYIITSNIIGHGLAVNPSKIYTMQLFGKIIAQSLETNLTGGVINAMIRKM